MIVTAEFSRIVIFNSYILDFQLVLDVLLTDYCKSLVLESVKEKTH